MLVFFSLFLCLIWTFLNLVIFTSWLWTCFKCIVAKHLFHTLPLEKNTVQILMPCSSLAIHFLLFDLFLYSLRKIANHLILIKNSYSPLFHLTFSFNLFLGNLAQAETVGREALELIPNDHSLMFSLANVLGKSQKYKVKHFSNHNL